MTLTELPETFYVLSGIRAGVYAGPFYLVGIEILGLTRIAYGFSFNKCQLPPHDELSTRHDILSNHLHCLSNLRNKCAHGARLYNSVYNPPPKLGIATLKKYPDLKSDSFLAYLIVIIRRLTQNDDKKALVDSFLNLINKYHLYLDLDLLGCPVNYEMILRGEID